jgi:hypothetical protein
LSIILPKMFNRLFFILLVLSTYDLKSSPTIEITWQLIHDNNYTIGQINHLHSQLFQGHDTIYPSIHKKYWARISVKNPNNQSFYISAMPNFNNDWFYQTKEGQWESVKSGLQITSDRRDHYLKLPSEDYKDSIYYVLMDVSFMNQVKAFIPTFKLHTAQTTNDREWYITLFSILSVIILLVYFVNIIVEYFLLKESTHIYYLVGLIGGLMYVLSYHSVIDLWTNFRYIKVISASLYQVYCADFSYILNRLSIMIICFGLINLATTFLKTKVKIPTWHKLLKYYLIIFTIANLVSLLITVFTSFPCDVYFITASNIMVIVAILLVIFSGVLCLRMDRRIAGLFLIAHILPFLFIILTSIYVEINTYINFGHVMMPYLTILSLPIGLNTLLTYRVIHVKDTLHENNILSQKMEMDNERIKHEKELEVLEKENFKNQLQVEKLTIENLELKVDLQNRQLLTSAMQIQKKDEVIHNISQEVSKMSKKDNSHDSTNKVIRSLLQNHETTESNWSSFKEHFEKIHPDFFNNLKTKHPDLSSSDIRLSAYIKLNLTNKEIATLQNIKPESVKRAKIRLKQKINLP